MDENDKKLEKVKKFIEEKKKNSEPAKVIKGKGWVTGNDFEWSMDLKKTAEKTGEYALQEAAKVDPENGYIVYEREGKKVREYVDGRIVVFDDKQKDEND